MIGMEMQGRLAERGRGAGAGEFAPPAERSGSQAWQLLMRNPTAMFGLITLLIIVAIAVLAPVLAPSRPLAIVGPALLWPGENPAFPLGTDAIGRDVLSGVLHGARISLVVGIAATFLSLTLGITIGAVAGYFGGWVDDLITRFTEIFQTIPSFVLLVVLVAMAQPSAATIVLGIALVSWDMIARLARAEFRAIRRRDYITAATAAGFGHGRIILREIMPNALPPLIVTSSIMVASAILMESALSFMGLGDPNSVSWGGMISNGREAIRTHWFLTAIPGSFIVATVLALNLLGDGLNDALNPRLNVSR